MMEAGVPRQGRQLPGPWLRVMHLAALSAVGVAQPLFDLLGRNPVFFVARRMSLLETLALTLGLALVVPLGFWAAQALIGLWSRKVAWWLHLLFVFGLCVLIALPLVRRWGMAANPTLVVAALAAGTFLCLYAGTQAGKTFLSFLSMAWVIVPAIFLTATPILRTVSRTVPIPEAQAPVLPGPLVMVVFDELPLISLLDGNHQIDAGRFPNFAALASTATWYPNAITVSGSTPSSVTAILTGRKPQYRSLPIFSEHPENLFTWFAGTGPIVAFESATRLCPEELEREVPWREGVGARADGLVRDLAVVYQHLTLPREWTSRLPAIADNWERFATRREEVAAYDERPARFSAFVDEIKPGPTRLYFVHVFLPHLPWSRLPDGKAYTDRPWEVAGLDLRHENWVDDLQLVAQGYRRHLLQVELVDRLLGGLLNRLRTTGLFDSTLLVVTADHGCNFRPGATRRGLLSESPLDVLAVPLLIKAPGQTAARVDSFAIRTLDIVPTVARILGVEPPWPMDGSPVPDSAPRAAWPPEGWKGQESLDRKIALFGEGRPDLPRPGPFKHLLGLPDRDLQAGATELEVVIRNRESFRDVDPDSSFIPLIVDGRARSPQPATDADTLTLAISVNGIVRAVTRTNRKANGWFRFTTMLSRTDLGKGANEIRAFRIEDPVGLKGDAG